MSTYIPRKVISPLPGKVIKAVHLPDPVLLEGFGKRAETGAICAEAGYSNVLLVTDTTLSGLGYADKISSSLADVGIQCTIFDEICSEPDTHIVEAGRKAALQCGCQCIIALGGGSVMDATKMIAAGTRLSHLPTGALMIKFLVVPEGTLPIIAIPSTAGTGAEITVGAIIKNASGNAKGSTVILGLKVTHVILDSELTVRAPRSVTASCGIDALSHGLEGCVANVTVPEDDALKSMECVRMVLENLPIVLETPGDIEARQKMCLAAHYGGNAINKQLAGYVHAFAHSIGAFCHIPHGHAIALCLLPIMEFQKEACRKQLTKVAIHCGLADAEALLEAIGNLIALCNLQTSVESIRKEDYPHLVRMIVSDSINYSSPITLKEEEIVTILDSIKAK